MSEKVIRRLLDDMEEAEGREVEADGGRVLIGIDGQWRELDLSVRNASKLRSILQPWLDNSRPAAGKLSAKRTVHVTAGKHGASGYSSEQLQAIRNWARKNGWPNLSDRGKVAAEVRMAFEAAGGLTVPEFSAL